MSYKKGVAMEVHVNGRKVKEYSHEGNTFIESRHGSQYTIKIKNDNAFRVMAVVSVDGLDVVTGKPAESSDTGYIIGSYSSTDIKGYRLSDTNSAAFVFTTKDKSYVSQNVNGNVRNSGVIGVRIFKEKPEKKLLLGNGQKVVEHHHYYYPKSTPVAPYYPKDPWYPWYPAPGDILYSSGPSADMATTGNSDVKLRGLSAQSMNNVSPTVNSSPQPNQSINASNTFDVPINYDSFDTGTGWGENQVDKIKKEVFKAGPVLTEVVIYYASGDALRNMGIDLSDTPKISEMPKPFGDSAYCRPPTGWAGK